MGIGKLGYPDLSVFSYRNRVPMHWQIKSDFSVDNNSEIRYCRDMKELLKAVRSWRKEYRVYINEADGTWKIRDNRSIYTNTDARYTLLEDGRPNRGFRYLADAKRYAEAIITESRGL